MQQRPVHEEPHEHVYEEEGERVPPEQVERGPGRQGPQAHALGDGLEEQEVRAHGAAELGPSGTNWELFFIEAGT